MIKKLHFIKLGEYNLTDIELFNLESWKRCYPDFEICYWHDGNIKELIEDCDYARFCLKYRYYGYVSDYLRLKIVYTYGGMYMDTDVYCVERIPNEYFKKAFIPWSPEFNSINTCTGTATFSPTKKNKALLPLVDKYRNAVVEDNPYKLAETVMNNKFIDSIFYEKGLDISTDPYGCAFNDVDLGDIQILNRIQFGFTDFRAEMPMVQRYANGKPIYLMHNYVGSWGVKNTYQKCDLIYFVLRDNTDIRKILNWVFLNWGKTANGDAENRVLMFFVNSKEGREEELIHRMRMIDIKDAYNMLADFKWKVTHIGDGVDYETESMLINNYLLTKTPFIQSIREYDLDN